MSQRSLQRVIVSSGARISNDRLLTGIGCARVTHRESLAIIILPRGAGAGVARPRRNSLGRRQRDAKRWAKKFCPGRTGKAGRAALIGAGDRGGVSADRGCNSGLVGLFAYLSPQVAKRFKPILGVPEVIFCPPLAGRRSPPLKKIRAISSH